MKLVVDTVDPVEENKKGVLIFIFLAVFMIVFIKLSGIVKVLGHAKLTVGGREALGRF